MLATREGSGVYQVGCGGSGHGEVVTVAVDGIYIDSDRIGRIESAFIGRGDFEDDRTGRNGYGEIFGLDGEFGTSGSGTESGSGRNE